MASHTWSLFLYILILLHYSPSGSDPGWIVLPSGTNEDLHSIYFFDKDTGWAASRRSLLKTFDGGLSWEITILDSNNLIYDLLFVTPDSGFMLKNVWNSGPGYIMGTHDGGLAWDTLLYLSDYMLSSIFFLNDQVGWVAGSYCIPFTTYGFIVRTIDGGATWSTPSQTGGTYIYSIYFSDQNQGYTVGMQEDISYWPHLHLSQTNDGGTNWQYNNSIPWVRGRLNSVHFYDVDTGWAVGEMEDTISYDDKAAIFKSTDGGNVWELFLFDQKFEWDCFNDVYFLDADTGWVISRRGQVIRTIDGGIRWRFQDSGVTSSLNDMFFLNADTGWIAGDDGIILKTTSGGVTAIDSDPEESIIIPEEIQLFQNYPNPFNSTTEISFYLSEHLPVTLEVFNIAGQRVATLLKGNMPIGRHTLNFQTDDLASGIYLYQLRTGNQFLQRKMVIIK